MADRTLVLAIFGNEAAADNAAAALKDSGLTSTDAIGVMAVNATGKLKEEKVGARSTGKGAGVGAARAAREMATTVPRRQRRRSRI